MFENESLLGHKPRRSRFWLSIFFSSNLLIIFIFFLQSSHSQSRNANKEVPIGSGRCYQITCPSGFDFPMCKRSKTDDSGQRLPPLEPCRIRVENQIDYDTKICAQPQCTFTECCVVTVWYAQQFSSSCGAAALMAAELELGYHTAILGMDQHSAWDAVRAREESIHIRTDDAYKGNRDIIIDAFDTIDAPTFNSDPANLQKVSQWTLWPKQLGDQFEGRNHLFLYNPSAILAQFLSAAFQSQGAEWNRKSLTETVHEMKDNQRVIALVRPPTGELNALHWVMIRPDGSIMDPSTCGTFASVTQMEASRSWVPVLDIAIKLVAPDPIRAPAIPIPQIRSGLSRSGASMDLASLAGALSDIGTAPSVGGSSPGSVASRSGMGMRRMGPSMPSAGAAASSASARFGLDVEDQVPELPHIPRGGSGSMRGSPRGSPRLQPMFGPLYAGSPPHGPSPLSSSPGVSSLVQGGSGHAGYYFSPTNPAGPGTLGVPVPGIARPGSAASSSAGSPGSRRGKRRMGDVTPGVPSDTQLAPGSQPGMRKSRTQSEINTSGSGSPTSQGPGSNPLPLSVAEAASMAERLPSFSAPLPGEQSPGSSIRSGHSFSAPPGLSNLGQTQPEEEATQPVPQRAPKLQRRDSKEGPPPPSPSSLGDQGGEGDPMDRT